MSKTSYNPSEKIWSGAEFSSVADPNGSLGKDILRYLNQKPNKIAQISNDSGIERSFKELRDQTIRAAQNLQKYNFEKGDVFAVFTKNNHEVAPIVFAALVSGNPMNGLDPTFAEAEIAHMLGVTKPKAVFCDMDLVEILKQCLQTLNSDVNVFTFCGSTDGTVAVSDLFAETGREEEFEPVRVDPKKDAAIIVCSSGSTGLPKAIALSHEIFQNRMATAKLDPEDVCFCYSSLYWLSGINSLLYCTKAAITRIITTEAFSPPHCLELIERHKVTKFFASVYQLIVLAKLNEVTNRDISSIRLVATSGCKVPFDAIVGFSKHIPNGRVAINYGLSELSGTIAATIAKPKDESVGELLPGVKVKIIGNEGQRLGVNEVGEIRATSPSLFLGYYGSPNETRDIFDEEGFICTGDIGYFDEDGLLFVIDRLKDFIRYRSYSMSPSEIESFLIRSPGIESICISSLHDYESGELPAAVIVRTENSKISEDEICDLVAEKFCDWKKLRGGVHFVDSLPLTPSGKVLRREVKRMLNESSRGERGL